MARTPTGRSTADYEGKVPAAKGTGPKNLAKGKGDAFNQVRKPTPKASKAGTPRMQPGKANPGYGNPPGGGASGVPKATSRMAGNPSRTINRPKTGRPRGGSGKPRADGASRI